MSTLERAIAIATEAHTGQRDKAGARYILHPLRVMLRLDNNDERIVGVLHDVLEDSDWTMDDLVREEFSAEIINAIDGVTRRDSETYDEFIDRVGRNKISLRVKLADLEDNCDLSRIAKPSARDFARIEKYRKAISHLKTKT